MRSIDINSRASSCDGATLSTDTSQGSKGLGRTAWPTSRTWSDPCASSTASLDSIPRSKARRSLSQQPTTCDVSPRQFKRSLLSSDDESTQSDSEATRPARDYRLRICADSVSGAATASPLPIPARMRGHQHSPLAVSSLPNLPAPHEDLSARVSASTGSLGRLRPGLPDGPMPSYASAEITPSDSRDEGAVQPLEASPEPIYHPIVDSPRDSMERQYVLPIVDRMCNSISTGTLCDLLDGKFSQHFDEIMVLDCRFPYEYEGGHVRRAISLQLNDAKQFFNNRVAKTQGASENRTCIVIHCEYSQQRGPEMYGHAACGPRSAASRLPGRRERFKRLRNTDREYHREQFGMLSLPEMYLLQGGYAKFYELHKARCPSCARAPVARRGAGSCAVPHRHTAILPATFPCPVIPSSAVTIARPPGE